MDIRINNVTELKEIGKTQQEEQLPTAHDVLREMHLQGQAMFGKAPFGYEIDFANKYNQIKGYDEVIYQMFYQYSRGCRMSTVARIVNELFGIKDETVKSGTQKNLRNRKLKAIFSNPIYMGYPSHNRTEKKDGKTYLNPIEKWVMSEQRYKEFAFIEEALWYEAYERLLNDPEFNGTLD